MAFPEDPRDLIVGMAFGHTQYEDPSGLTYEQVAPGAEETDPGAVLGNVRYERGRIGDAPQTSPTKITFSLRNDDGEFSPRNVTGPRYGTLRQGTPTRVSVDVGSGPVTLATAHALGFEPVTDGPDIDPRVPVTALGLLNRISRDQEIRSAMSLFIGFQAALGNVRSWWPLESGSTVSPALASGIAGGPDLAADGVVAGGAEGPPGSVGATDVSSGATLAAALVPDTGNDDWSFHLAVKLSAVTGSATVWQLWVDDLLYAQLRVTDTPGAELALDLDDGTTATTLTAAAPIDDDEWHYIRARVTDVGAGSSSSSVLLDGDTVINSTTAVDFARPDRTVLNASGDLTAICHCVYAAFTTNLYTVFTAVPDEAAGTRIDRVLLTAGIPGSSPDGGASMGLQPAATLATILRECEDADSGVLLERRDGRIDYHLNEERYNLTPAWELDYGTEADPGDIADLLMSDDDRDQYNQITVSDADGNLGIAEETDGPVGSDTSTGVGPRPFPARHNVYDPDDLRHHAGWLLRKGTIDKPRYIVVVDLYNNPSLVSGYIAAATDSDTDGISYRITITGAPAQDHGPNDLDLIVEGEVAELGPDRWLVQLYCEPYEPYNVRELNEDTDPDSNVFAGRWAEEEGTVLDEAIDADDTSFDVDPNGGTWTTDDDEFDTDLGVPLIVEFGGERMQVTDIADAGGGIYTFTVVRSVNGVVKAHDAGTPLQVVDAQIWAL